MNLFKSLKNRKGAIGAIGAISIGMIILILAFALASVSFVKPVLAAHDTTVTIQPELVNCGDLGQTYILTVKNNGASPDNVREVRIYDDVDGDGNRDPGIVEFHCGLPPAGWTLDDRTVLYHYCQYETTVHSAYMIHPGETKIFTFSSTLDSTNEKCGNEFKVATIDDKIPVGEVVFKFPFVSVDCVDPVLDKSLKYGNGIGICPPDKQSLGDECWIQQSTCVYFDAYDNTDECDKGIDYCDYYYTVDGVEHEKERVEAIDGHVNKEICFNEDSVHVLNIKCYDLAGNEIEDTETFRVDNTPPVTTKIVSDPKKIIHTEYGDVEWIDGKTTITLNPTDPDTTGFNCNIGVDKTWYMNAIDLTEELCRYPDRYCVPNTAIPSPYVDGAGCINKAQDYCEKGMGYTPYTDDWYDCVEELAYTECKVDPLWKLYRGSPINKKEESCHLLQYFSVDELGNIEPMKVNCFFVDLTPPYMYKDNGGAIPDDGEKMFITPDNPKGEFHWLTTKMPITLTCDDTWKGDAPHPSEGEKLCYRVSYDYPEWDWITDKYCINPLTPEGYCCEPVNKEKQFIFYFKEESMHNLEYYCIDAVEKKSPVEIQYYKVDDTPPSITKTMIGTDHLGECPPGPSPIEPCYVKDSRENGVHIDVTDGGAICAVDKSICSYGLWWYTDETTCKDKYGEKAWDGSKCLVEGGEFGEEGKDIIFHEDSEHRLFIQCRDALNNWNSMDIETFLVDSLPPVTKKTYGEPTKFLDGYRWITKDTPIALTTKDEKVGPEKIFVRVTKLDVPDVECIEECDFDGAKDFKEYVVYKNPDHIEFKIPEDSCHLIEFYAIDKLGNEEQVHKQCVFVDNTPPKEIKVVGDPNVPIDSDGGDCGTITGDLDVLFLFDLTGSMGGVIGNAKTNAISIMTAIQGLVPNAEFGVGSFMDYNGDFDSCSYNSTYGSGPDYPWKLDQGITSDTTDVSDAINGLSLGYGDDGPESYARALYESQFVGWRTSAKKIVVIFEDSVPHDCDLGDYDISCDYSTGRDPGIDNTVGTSDDLDWTDVVAQLKAAGVSVVTVDSGSGWCNGVWKYASDETDGLYATLGSDFTKTIVDSVTEVVGCNKDWWVRDHVTPITLDCIDQEPHPVAQETMCYKVSNVDGTDPVWLTEQYCNEFDGEYNDLTGECCAYVGDGGEYTFTFMEDSNHNLEFYCKDHLGNTGETHLELFKVDSVPPTTTKTYEGPFYESAEGYEFVDTITKVKLEATDGGAICHVDGVKTYYRVINLKEEGWDYCKGMCDEWDPRHPGDWLTYKNPFSLDESCNIIEFYSEDALGNAEKVDWQCVFSDHTAPITRKWFAGPQYPNDGDKDGTSHWIAPSTEIHLEATDPEPHPSGVKETYYRFILVDDKYCRDQTLCQGFDETITKEYDKASPKLMYILEESCHLIEYYSVDNVGKVEDVNRQCVFVDKTPPVVVKTISDPKEQWAGDNTFYPGLTERCWSTDSAKTIECWKITLGTQLSLKCNDPEPHPVDHNKMCFQIELDGTDPEDDRTEKYCGIYGGQFKDGWCCIEGGIEKFNFVEESQHDLKVKCIDALGNEGKIDEEKFKVEGCTWELCLYKKWNLVSVPFNLLNDDPEVVFKDAKDDIAAVWTYDNGVWYTWIPGKDGTLKHIKPGWGYWVLAKEDECFDIAGSLFSPLEVPPSRDLQAGWNLIGYYGNTMTRDGLLTVDTVTPGKCLIPNKPVYCALNSLVDTGQGFPRWSSLWNYFNHGGDVAGWYGLDACVDGIWTSYMDPGKGYWIEMDVKDSYAPATNCIWNEDMSCVMPIFA